MTNILKIPANSQVYLTAICDSDKDKFDVVDFITCERESTFPAAWAYWKMEEETSGDRIDATGNGHDLIPYTESYHRAPGYATGVIGNAVSLDRVELPYGVTMLQTASGPTAPVDSHFTYVMWVNIPALTEPGISGATLLEFTALGYADLSFYANDYDFEGNKGIAIRATAGLDVYIMPELVAGTDPRVFEFTPSTWHFVVLYYDGTGLYLEVDNVLVASDLGSCTTVNGEMATLIGGAQFGVDPTLVDLAGVYLEAIDSAMRTQLYNSGAGWSPY
jgi:hypothetical protein